MGSVVIEPLWRCRNHHLMLSGALELALEWPGHLLHRPVKPLSFSCACHRWRPAAASDLASHAIATAWMQAHARLHRKGTPASTTRRSLTQAKASRDFGERCSPAPPPSTIVAGLAASSPLAYSSLSCGRRKGEGARTG